MTPTIITLTKGTIILIGAHMVYSSILCVTSLLTCAGRFGSPTSETDVDVQT